MHSTPQEVAITTYRPRAGARIPAGTYAAILEMAVPAQLGAPLPTASQIWKELKKRHLDDASLRTVERILGELPRQDGSAPWTLNDAQPTDLPLILEVLAEASGRPSGREAHWIATIRRAFPDLADFALVGQLSMYAARGGHLLEMVEQVLTYTPWRDGGAAIGQAHEAGRVSYQVISTFGYEAAAANARLAARSKGGSR